MHFSSTLVLLPAFCLALACNSPAGGGTSTDSDSGTDSSSSSGSTGSATTNNTNGGGCVPGQSIACSCNNGQMGAQTCNANGEYDPCECTGGTSNTTSPTTADPTTGDVTTTDPGTSTTDPGTSTTDPGTSTTDPGTSSTGTSTTGGGDQPYGPCPNGDECLQGETCITGQSMMGDWTLCTPGECQDAGDCDSNACNDAPGDGQFQLYCVPQTCDMQNPCPDGMQCYAGFGMGATSVCLWPN